MKCVYLVNDHPKYMTMVINSVKMLRRHNDSIPIVVLFIYLDSISEAGSRFFELCKAFDVKIIERGWFNSPGEEDFFFINKTYLKDFEEDSILFIDADTFVFGDVGKIFKKYSGVSFVGCENKWMANWSNELISTSNPISPFNGGILLFNNGFHRECMVKLPDICKKIREKSHPISDWIYQTDPNGYHREEFGTSCNVADSGASYQYFDREYCYNILRPEDVNCCEQSIIFHSYVGNWQQIYNKINQAKVKLRPFGISRNRS